MHPVFNHRIDLFDGFFYKSEPSNDEKKDERGATINASLWVRTNVFARSVYIEILPLSWLPSVCSYLLIDWKLTRYVFVVLFYDQMSSYDEIKKAFFFLEKISFSIASCLKTKKKADGRIFIWPILDSSKIQLTLNRRQFVDFGCC